MDAKALGERLRQGVHGFRPKQGDEMIVVQEPPETIDDEQQAALRKRGLLDQKLLPIGFLTISPN